MEKEGSLLYYSTNHKKFSEISLLLSSQNIPHHIKIEGPQLQIWVESQLLDKCRILMDVYEKENLNWADSLRPQMDMAWSASPILMLLPPTLLFFLQINPGFPGMALTRAGECDAHRIYAGEVWRCITGLSLHADGRHYVSNLLSGYIILNFLVAKLPFGAVMFMLLILSATANYLVAFSALSTGHHSIGFSTSVFGALGMLASQQWMENMSRSNLGQRSLAPLFGGIFLVIMMGTGENSDIRAHVFGFAMGVLGGLFPWQKWLPLKNLGLQWILVLLSAVIYGGAWALAWPF